MPTNPIEDVIRREGGESNDPLDKGGHTVEGISERANPDLFANGKTPSPDQVRQRYLDRYVNGPGFNKVVDTKLREQLIDFGVNSGPSIAIQKLQVALGVTVDGILGPDTLESIKSCDPRLLNNELVRQRVLLIARIVQKNPSQLKYIVGWADRATQFLV